jgi:carboxyl-terminal processing protease
LRAVVVTLILSGSVFGLPVSAFAQETASPPDSGYLELPAPADAETAMRRGAELERARRWIDAITHYEKAVEQFPEDRQLTYGLRRSKIHFGIDRRYSDGSFERTLLTKSQSDALALFDEIYSQVRSNYVEPVSVTSFVAHGTESLYLALANDKFVSRNVPRASSESIGRLRQTLRDQYWNKNVEGSGRARATVLEVCRLCRSTVGLPETAVVMEYVFGGCNALDDYSNYLTPDRLDDLYGNIEGEFVGLGIEMQAETGRGMLLVNVLPESPAAAGGMRAGEHIVSINSVDCRGMTADEAAKLLRGPVGSTVELELLASSAEQPRRGRFVRRPVTVKSVDRVQMVEGEPDVGYIRMSGFQKTTAQELDAALAKLEAQGMKKLIWDLRDNPGGLLTAAVEVLDRFIAEGVLVSTKGRSLDQNWTYSAHRAGTHSDIEIVLLVNENSASASEIVAGAIRDHKRGVIVGRKSFGKWSVQSILPIRDKTGLRLTTAKFYSPADHNYSKIGVKPDIEVPLMPDVVAGYRGGDAMPLVGYGALDLSNPDIVAARNVFHNANQAVTSR